MLLVLIISKIIVLEEKTGTFCNVCNVPLCKECRDPFHEEMKLSSCELYYEVFNVQDYGKSISNTQS